ncbi:hypothetical protein Ae168Ps1_2659c [Pseudonocardia sp. Ae168_Ps1]|uniref:DUF6355 family natural product biosynthesis protein n=1 Tax=unclassified Pseudonocardia TaxID=2619320 RepID=UPI0001FFE847|nr:MULTISPECIES: DUF6355 family natural product biosynthesis protein [unclassified Pseudonocardia]ALE72090.1 hypothetical protein FRP1_01145 [Pseudonocardia sp. EC080625-04]ALL75373.1 hypothetical protein AD006_08775 [Pseudonocardia sp. EC080610-09]ALL82398.1 hypothetical protein AD017_16605 [Pseudonocardia sp. EC080619-01]OLL74272.1 hypothetical protein Ae150APs1_2650c [Pseudonocardia sp. Ae150A_Ps1]OLL80253.1 hypothetical protein Ae168Ps1_2659c [Pseudonocardia sp. Ae168_Ps1]
MRRRLRGIVGGTVAALAVGSAVVAGAGTAVVAGAGTAEAAKCGYSTLENDTTNNKANYLNCSPGNERIRVEYTYATEEKCVTPGDTPLFANPDLGAVRNAVPIGTC